MKISIGMGFLFRPIGEVLSAFWGAEELLSVLVWELRLSRLPIPDSSTMDRRRSEPVNLRCFCFFAGLTGEGSEGRKEALDFLLRMVNLDIQEDDTGDDGFVEESVEEDHLERKAWLEDADEGSRVMEAPVLYILAMGLSGMAFPGEEGIMVGEGSISNPRVELGELR